MTMMTKVKYLITGVLLIMQLLLTEIELLVIVVTDLQLNVFSPV